MTIPRIRHLSAAFSNQTKIDVEYMPSKSALKFGHWGQSNHNDAFTLRGVSPPLVGVGVTLSTPGGVLRGVAFAVEVSANTHSKNREHETKEKANFPNILAIFPQSRNLFFGNVSI